MYFFTTSNANSSVVDLDKLAEESSCFSRKEANGVFLVLRGEGRDTNLLRC